MNHITLDLHIFDANTQTTETANAGNDLSAEMKTYYEKRLIDIATPKLVHDQFGDFYPVPKNGGKTVEFRRYSPLGKATTPLTEGVTPDGNSLNVTTVTAEVEQYGDWIGLSDMFDMTAIDNNVVQATRLLGNQAGRTLDSVTREVLHGGTNVRYAPAGGAEITARADITDEAKLTPELIFRAKADLAAMNADPIDDSYVAIIHPYAAFDLMRSEEWIDVHKYADPDSIYSGEIGKLGGVRFIETSEAKIVGPAVVSDNLSRLHVADETASGSKTIKVSEVLNARTLTKAIPVYINGVANTIVAIAPGNTGTTLSLGTALAETCPAGSILCGRGAGKDGSCSAPTPTVPPKSRAADSVTSSSSSATETTPSISAPPAAGRPPRPPRDSSRPIWCALNPARPTPLPLTPTKAGQAPRPISGLLLCGTLARR